MTLARVICASCLIFSGAAQAADVDAFSPAVMAGVQSAFETATPVKASDVDAWTEDRMSAILVAYDTLDSSPETDTLSTDVVLRIQRQFDEVLQTNDVVSLLSE